ncbi:unnamed protein product [Penicillium camemberti]|uniref:Str. FM013 n=1 Tax=Penicillium camemberti (strain FM 013) TaxID=1429867 RepID=A0A0G4NYR2_PENC3|nr:unnamed protein product [Penicillium camemberti]
MSIMQIRSLVYSLLFMILFGVSATAAADPFFKVFDHAGIPVVEGHFYTRCNVAGHELPGNLVCSSVALGSGSNYLEATESARNYAEENGSTGCREKE